ncbi:MAG: hypothetical protein KJ964_06810 [Verrucomicrobia bacterium]|nr:hypothetical protein [Verrucomicrobiota bacterium]MBU1734261.1 hypothetical protein [Verrucomicrobiota bacterium]MBU1855860.1 hypothetical protein [Verrucomicrobiota bacterium]
MLRFIHGYDEHYLPGLVKNGLLNKNSGIKIIQHFATPENEKFNIIAAKGGKLYNLVKENGFPFYIDRLQGGTFYSKYDFDHSLLREYCAMLGKWFLGIQMHEWVSVRNNDWNRIRTQLAGTPPPWTEQQIHDAIKAVSACKWCIHLSCGTAYEYSQIKYSETWQEYIEELRQLFELRQDETGGLLLPCDSYGMATAMEYELAARAAMPEVGAQISLMRLQVALARGMSGVFERIWGTYYEPWGGQPCSTCHFFEGQLNEWRLDNTIYPYDFSSNGPNGGSSRALQRRIYYYSLMSGAQFLGEEWGVSNTFYNWRDYPLTPYGTVKKDFISFAEKYSHIKPFVPIAIVLPVEFKVVDIGYINDPNSDVYLGRILAAGTKEFFGHIRKVLRLVYARCGQTFGNEGHTITNSRFGDFFDVIYEDAGEQAFSKYAYLVDASSDGGFAKSVSGEKHKVLKSTDIELLEHGLGKIIKTDFPCNVFGGVHWLLSRSGDKWLLTMFNNEGVERSAEKGDCFLDEADIKTAVCFREAPGEFRILKSWPEGGTLERQEDGRYWCTIPAGGFYILEF